jgi:MSHA biogenesis protein MshQ
VVEDEPSETLGSGDAYRKAGEGFGVTLRAVNYESGDDANTNSDLANNTLTPNFGGHSSIDLDLEFSLQAPTSAGTSPGSLQGWDDQLVRFNNTANQGEYLFSGLTWSEVGIISMNVAHNDYLGGGETIIGARPNIGRFYPDHFDVAANSGSFSPYCGAFSYIGQGFGYDTRPSLTITAKNIAGDTTQNYTDSAFMKLALTDITRVFPNIDYKDEIPPSQFGVDGVTAMVVSNSPGGGEVLSANGPGVMTYLFSATDNYTYTKDANSLIDEFLSKLTININDFSDVDGAAATANPPVTPTGINLRYGRVVLQNAFGPETEALKIPMSVQNYNGTSFITNTNDDCSTYNSAVMELNTNLAASGSSAASGSGIFDSGLALLDQQIELSAPGATHQGVVDICLNVADWLKFDWNGDGLDLTQVCDTSMSAVQGDNPMSTASFDQYRGHDRIIYWREVQ